MTKCNFCGQEIKQTELLPDGCCPTCGRPVELFPDFDTPNSNALAELVLTQVSSGKQIHLKAGETKTLGRAELFSDLKTSRKHCLIEYSDNCFYISDLATTNGTFVNGKQITSKTALAEGQHLRFGLDVFLVNVVQPEQGDNISSDSSVQVYYVCENCGYQAESAIPRCPKCGLFRELGNGWKKVSTPF